MMTISGASFELLPFHIALRDLLQREDAEVWRWFERDTISAELIDSHKFELLKSTYRVDRPSQPALYEVAENVATTLEIAAPLTIYQAQNPVGLNAGLAYVPGEVHVVLSGPVATQLNEVELRSLFGHELTHYLLNDRWKGEMRVVERMLSALANDRSAHVAHFASLRLLLLYNEILCDRGAYQVTNDLQAVVSTLLKVGTEVNEVSADAFLKQADEIFGRGPTATNQIDHPEPFIRARAIRLWAEKGTEANAEVAEMIEGRPGLETLDLLEQRRVAEATRRVIDELFLVPWFRTDLTLAHAKLFFDDYKYPQGASSKTLTDAKIRTDHPSLTDYYSFLLLDFVAVDRDLDEPALALALTVAEQIEVKSRFLDLARQELKLRKNQIERIDQNKARLLADVEQGEAKK